MPRRLRKATNKVITAAYLEDRASGLAKAGYEKPKWISFCETLLGEGYSLCLYEARQTVSKYITVRRDDVSPFKVRFSNHRPIRAREVAGDCDFFVGVTNLRTTTTGQAISAVRNHFTSSSKG